VLCLEQITHFSNSSLGEELEDDSGWMAHELRFKKDANVYEPTVDDYILYGEFSWNVRSCNLTS
jgi:hypothetical protein